MSIKKIAKKQPENFEFTKDNIIIANDILKNYPQEKSKVLSWLFYILHRNKIITGFHWLR